MSVTSQARFQIAGGAGQALSGNLQNRHRTQSFCKVACGVVSFLNTWGNWGLKLEVESGSPQPPADSAKGALDAAADLICTAPDPLLPHHLWIHRKWIKVSRRFCEVAKYIQLAELVPKEWVAERVKLAVIK